MGSVDDPGTDAIARELCARAGAVVVSVDYRLAVDGVCYPVPHDDVVAGIRWVRDHAGVLGIDPARISVGGDSAGGNLSAGAVLRLRDDDRWTPAALLLVYPTLHPGLPPLSAPLQAAVGGLPALLRFLPDDVAEMHRNYLGGAGEQRRRYAMPGIAVLDGLCPTVVVNAECDDLRASGEAFAASAAQAGVDVRQVMAPGMLHSFLMLPDTIEPAARARRLLAETVRTAGVGGHRARGHGGLMAETVAPAGRRSRPRRAPGVLLAVACAAQFVCVLDTSIVNVALPPMQDSLGLSPTGLQWVVSSYTLTFAGFLLLGGRVGDLFGRRRAFLGRPAGCSSWRASRRGWPRRAGRWSRRGSSRASAAPCWCRRPSA